MTQIKKTKMRDPKSDKVFLACNYLLLSIILILVLYPLVYIISASFSSGEAVAKGKVFLWPVEFNLRGYEAILSYDPIITGYINSLIYTVSATILSVIVTIMAAYPLSRKTLYGRKALLFLFYFTTMFGGGLIPTYLLMKDLRILNTMWVMIIPGALNVFNIIITRTYFSSSIPEELMEAAKLDGCSDIKYLTRIVVPLAKPIIAVISLYCAVGNWNSFFNGLMYLNDPKLYPLQLILRDLLITNKIDTTMINVEKLIKSQELETLLKYSVIVAASLPLMIMYPFIQKYFVKGVMIGSLKG